MIEGRSDHCPNVYTVGPTGRRDAAVETSLQDDGSYRTVDITWNYDSEDRLIQELTHVVGQSASTDNNDSYYYDLVGNRLTYFHNFDTTYYSYDANDRLVYASTYGGYTNSYDSLQYHYANPNATGGHGGTAVTSITENKSSENYDFNSGTDTQVSSTINTTYAYNLQGQLASVGIAETDNNNLFNYNTGDQSSTTVVTTTLDGQVHF